MKASDYIRKGWTQEASARDSNGEVVDISSPSAVCWCVSGALMAAYGVGGWLAARNKLVAVLDVRLPLTAWNDFPGRTQAEVLEACEKAGV